MIVVADGNEGSTRTVRILVKVLRIYQVALSPLFGPACRFHPSCSEYAKESARTHGALLGLWYALRRLVRCHPFCAGGLDPVPAPRKANKTKLGEPPLP
jgi:uncharacterized protein